MSQEQWNAVDSYIGAHLVPTDPVLDAALEDSRTAGLSAINVAPNQGKLLNLLATIQGATEILEVGTLGGYSTIWLARALPAAQGQGRPRGRVVTLEIDPHTARVAQKNIARAGFSEVVDLRVGPALDSFVKLSQEGRGPFDFIFIDADKANIPAYFEWSLKLARAGTIIVVDNVVRGGRVLEEASADPNIRGVRRFNELVAKEPRVDATAIQTVGSKGYDGFALVRVRS